jgi:hypothetical protein
MKDPFEKSSRSPDRSTGCPDRPRSLPPSQQAAGEVELVRDVRLTVMFTWVPVSVDALVSAVID